MRTPAAVVAWALLAPCLAGRGVAAEESAEEQVRRTEIAFAKTMADRDHKAFVSFLSEGAIFMGRTTLRGREAIAAGWRHFYEGPSAPFSWEPERVEVLESGSLGVTSGPVRDPSGRRIGTFNSVWRRERDGRWRILIDIGCPSCEAPPSPSPSASPSKP
jgi:ketosteroid isomerase-like protein